MSPDMALPLRIFRAAGRPATLELLRVALAVVRDRRLSWTAVGLLAYLLTQRARVVDYHPAPLAERGRITLEQLANALAVLAECGYLVAHEDGWRVRSGGDGKQPYPYG